MIKNLEMYMHKPELYAPSSNAVFWTYEHISKYLLEAHLNPDVEASSRKFDFIDKSAKWISKEMPSEEHPEIPALSPHELHHTYGTLLRGEGVDIYSISKVLGHSSVKVTEKIYVHNDIEVLKKAMEKAF